jgi:DNA replication protein DnaD
MSIWGAQQEVRETIDYAVPQVKYIKLNNDKVIQNTQNKIKNTKKNKHYQLKTLRDQLYMFRSAPNRISDERQK